MSKYISLRQEIEEYFRGLGITVSCEKNGIGKRTVKTRLHGITFNELEKMFVNDLRNSIITLRMPYHLGFLVPDLDVKDTVYIFCEKKRLLNDEDSKIN